MELVESVTLEDQFLSNLEAINNIAFTKREIDIVACIIGGRTSKKIAAFLSVSPKTIEAHIRNIMLKLDCNSRECIIDFIEKSGKFAAIKNHYATLLVKKNFELELKKISKLPKKNNKSCLIIYHKKQKNKDTFSRLFEKHLNLTGCKVAVEYWDNNNIQTQNIDYVIYCITNEFSEQLKTATFASSTIFILLNNKIPIDFYKKLSTNTCIDFTDQQNYYFSFFELLKKILPTNNLDKNILEFKKQYTMLSDYSSSPQQNWFIENNNISNNKNKKILITTLFLSIIFLFGFLTLYNNISNSNIEKHQLIKLTKPWGLPDPIQNFTGRREKLKKLKKTFEYGGNGIIKQTIIGMGGVGKTTLAIEYGHRSLHNKTYDFVAFIKATNELTLYDDFKSLAMAFGMSTEDIKSVSVNDLIKFVYQKLANYNKVLLIFDNAQSLRIIRGIDNPIVEKQANFEPPATILKKVHWLITTTNSQFSKEHLTINLSEFTKQEAKDYIQKRLGAIDDVQLNALTNVLGKFPLALAQATSYINENKNKGWTIDKYIKVFNKTKENSKILLDATTADDHHGKTVYVTWKISLDELSNTSPLSVDILNSCALLSTSPIPLNLIREIYSNKTEVELINALKELEKYSFIDLQQINENIQSIKLHVLLQKVILINLENYKNKEVLLTNILDKIFLAICNCYPWDKPSMQDYNLARLLLPHVETIFAYIEKITPTMTPKTIQLMSIIDDAYDALGDYLKRKKILGRMLAMQKKYYETRNLEVAKTLFKLATVCGNLGDSYKEKELLEEVLAINLKYYKTEDQSVVAAHQLHKKNPTIQLDMSNTYHNLGNAYGDLGESDKQKYYLEKSLAIKIEHYKTRDHIDVAETLHDLAVVYGYLGYKNKYEESVKEVLATRIKHYKTEDHIEVARALHDLGDILTISGNLEKAKHVLEKALAIKIKHYQTREHVDVARTLHKLANVASASGNAKKQKKYLEEALAIKIKHYQTRNHVRVARTLHKLANAYGTLGDKKTQKEYLEEALAIKMQHYQNKKNIDIAKTLHDLSNVYGALGDPKLQKKYLEEALETQQK